MSMLLTVGLCLMGLAAVSSCIQLARTMGTARKVVNGNMHAGNAVGSVIGNFRNMALAGIPWVLGIGITVIAIVRDYVLPVVNG
jgi:hypothetical protein